MTVKRALIVFAKEPEPGRVKTRLAKSIGEEKALRLYKAFVQDVLRTAKLVQADHYLFYDGKTEGTPFLDDVAPDYMRLQQVGEDLGGRMNHAFEVLFAKGYNQVIIIGSDCLTVTPALMTDAFTILDNHDSVLGPSYDGGYYLIGFSHQVISEVLHNMVWSTEHVCKETVSRLNLLQKSYRILEMCEDIDTLENLKRLEQKILQFPHLSYTIKALLQVKEQC